MRPRSGGSFPWWPAVVLATVVLATIGVYAAALRGPFLMDDFDAILPLAGAQSAGLGWDEVLRSAPAHIRDRWLSNLSFLLTHAAAGGAMPPSAFAFKLGNLLVHLACGLALFALARRLVARWGDARRATWVALVATALFLLHPLLLSTVMYPVQRMAQLSTLFLLLAAHAYLRWRERVDHASTIGHALGIAQAGGFALLAFLCKENGALAPLLFAVIEVTAFRWPARDSAGRGAFETGFGLLCAAPLLLGALALGWRWEAITDGYARREFGLVERLLTQLHVMADYVAQIVWPRIGSMGLYHDDVVVRATPEPTTLLLGAALIAAVAAAWLLRRRAQAFAFGVLWFLAAHALESTVIALELVFEHRNYLALPGPALAFAWWLGSLPRVAGATVALAACVALGWQTARRSVQWQDYPGWIAAEAANHPRSLRAGNDLMLFLVASGRDAEAAGVRMRLADAHPDNVQPTLLKLAHACRGGPLQVATFSAPDLALLRTAEVGKDAFHAYVGILDSLPRRCAAPDWQAFAAAAAAVSANPALQRDGRALTAWLRLRADAALRLDDWSAVETMVQSVLQREADDPRDWLLLAEAHARRGDARGYAQARSRALGLLGGQPGQLAPELARIEALLRASTRTE